MPQLPPVPISGFVASSYHRPYKAFTDDQGKRVPGGSTPIVWVVISDSTDPLCVRGVPDPLPRQGDTVAYMVQQYGDRIVFVAPASSPAPAPAPAGK